MSIATASNTTATASNGQPGLISERMASKSAITTKIENAVMGIDQFQRQSTSLQVGKIL